MKQKAVIYCRVSSRAQVLEGHGLEGQETSCMAYIMNKGYKYIKTFIDDGVSGAKRDREGMQELLKFLIEQKGEIVVVIDDIKRFARDIEVHRFLKKSIKMSGCRLESPHFNFDETPEGEFNEGLQALWAELERKQNARQVINRQSARLERGYWPFFPPTGYVSIKDPIHGKLLVKQEPNATILKEAFEGYANDRFLTKTDVQKFLNSMGFQNKHGQKTYVYLQRVEELLRRVVYTGYIDYPKRGIKLRKGYHEALISLDTYQKVQDKLDYKKLENIGEEFAMKIFL